MQAMIEDLFKLDSRELVLCKTKKELNLNAGVGCEKGLVSYEPAYFQF